MTDANVQGDVGEVLTAFTLRSECNMNVIRNVYIPVNQHYTEIDMIGVSEYGVFVIENKNYSGIVLGDTGSKYWIVKYPFRNDIRLYNPVMQNITHRDAVRKHLESLGYNGIPIFKPVIFNDKGIILIRNSEKSVFTLSSFVNAYSTLKTKNLDKSTISDLLEIFHRCSNLSDEMKEIHKSLMKRGS